MYLLPDYLEPHLKPRLELVEKEKRQAQKHLVQRRDEGKEYVQMYEGVKGQVGAARSASELGRHWRI